MPRLSPALFGFVTVATAVIALAFGITLIFPAAEIAEAFPAFRTYLTLALASALYYLASLGISCANEEELTFFE